LIRSVSTTEATVGDPVGVAQRQPALLTAVRAHEDLGAAIGQRPDARIVERPDAVVDQVEVELGAARERASDNPTAVSRLRCSGPVESRSPSFFLARSIGRRA
jgi:hypothetical protein